MIRIDKVVTRGGDRGETSLGDGARIAKDSARIEAIGAVDEANAAIGLLRAALPAGATGSAESDRMLARIQNELFDLGADLCAPGTDGDRLRLDDAPSIRLEREIAAMNAGLPPLASFVLPGGSAAAAHAHLARATARRAERRVVHLAAVEAVNPAVVIYLNRLSDHLFVLGRVLNDQGANDVPWVPGGGSRPRA